MFVYIDSSELKLEKKIIEENLHKYFLELYNFI